MNYCKIGAPLAVCITLALGATATAATPAFPGAEGFGTETTHARGKPVFHVTRLDDEDKWQTTTSQAGSRTATEEPARTAGP